MDGHALTSSFEVDFTKGATRPAAPYEIHGEAGRAGRTLGPCEIAYLGCAWGRGGGRPLGLGRRASGRGSGNGCPRPAWSSHRRGPDLSVAEDPAHRRRNAPRSVRAPVRLSAVTTGKITLLTFFYTYCADPIGCPLAYRTLLDVRTGVGRIAGLEQRVRFLSVSLDPTTDTQRPSETIARWCPTIRARVGCPDGSFSSRLLPCSKTLARTSASNKPPMVARGEPSITC